MAELFDKKQRVAHEQIAITQDYLKNPRVTLQLGEAATRRMVALAGRLYVPEIVNGKIMSEAGGIPVVSLQPGERVTHDAGLADEQKERVAAAVKGSYGDIDHLEGLLRPRSFQLPPQAVGVTLTQKAPLDVGPDGYELRGVPAIILNNQKNKREGYSTTTLPHELVHVGQSLVRPVRKKTDHGYMKEEMQAYNIQSKILRGVGIVGGDATHTVSQAYELWRREGLSLDTADDVAAFSDVLYGAGVPQMHPKQPKSKK